MYIFQSRIHPLPPVNLLPFPPILTLFSPFLVSRTKETWSSGTKTERSGESGPRDAEGGRVKTLLFICAALYIYIYIYFRRRVAGILFKSLCVPRIHYIREEEGRRVKRRASPWSFYYRDHLFVNIIYTLRGQHAPP